jgi:hypothetical protein
MPKKIKRTDGCPYCGGSGGCYGQCDERWLAMIEMICRPMLKLQKDFAKVLRRRNRRAK